MGIKVISTNRKARHNYEIIEKFEAGLALTGTEVKALRAGKVNLSDGWLDFEDSTLVFLKDIHIGHYEFGNRMNHEETRPRQVLLHKKEMHKLSSKLAEKGLAAVPLRIYFKGQFIKIELGLGKGKKLYDKRESKKQQDANRQIQRALKHKN